MQTILGSSKNVAFHIDDNEEDDNGIRLTTLAYNTSDWEWALWVIMTTS